MLAASVQLPSPFGAAWIYPVVTGMALAVALTMAQHRALASGVAAKGARRLVFACVVSLLLGGHLAWLLRHFGELESPLQAIAPFAGRTQTWVGLAVMVWVVLALARRAGAKERRWLDALAPAGAALWLGERLGAWLAGQDAGIVMHDALPWGMAYPQGTALWSDHVRALFVPQSAAFSLPTHPVQLYSAVLAGGLLFVLMRREAQLRHHAGMAFGLALLMLALDDLLWDRLRVAYQPQAFLVFSGREFLALIGLVYGVWLIRSSKGSRPAAKPVDKAPEATAASRPKPSHQSIASQAGKGKKRRTS